MAFGRMGAGGRASAGASVIDPQSLVSQATKGLWLRASDLTGFADGAAININWPDRSGFGNHAVRTGSPTFTASVVNGRPGVLFNNSGKKFVSASFLDASFDTACSLYGVVRQPTDTLKIWASHLTTKLYAGSGSWTVNTSALSDTQIQLTRPARTYLGSFRYNGSAKKAGCFTVSNYATLNVSPGEGATGNLGLSGTLTIGQMSDASFVWEGEVCELFMLNAFLSDADDIALVRSLCSHYGLNAWATSHVMFDGNSLTSGVGSSGGPQSAAAYPGQTLTLLGADYTGTNHGVDGHTTAQRAAAAPALIDAKFTNYRPKNVAVLWEVTNDLHFNEDASAAITQYASWCQGRKDAGFRVIAMTATPRSDSYGGHNAARLVVNDSIRANYTTYAHSLVDIAAHPILGNAANLSDGIYYSDFVHMTDLGYSIVAQAVKAAIIALP